ncbi:probable N-acetyltransferase HLS1 isoform X2 [Euphorbia lathyris]|uniref:probable N-acetyltransferase HLS1 isoform X2 n=1 Tax=Euphorbia lathyris TaxID=212925 RepID=UPI003313CA3B
MSVKIAADNFQSCPDGGEVRVRRYEDERDKAAVEEMERRCEIGEQGKTCLVTDLLGDPICRVRHFSSHVMLVAEYGERREIVGVIRACIKTVTRGNSSSYVKLGYILGLRVSPFHRLGIGTKLVEKIEEWCKQNGAEYSYMATDCTNQPSINLFTRKCCYTKFRTLSMLVQPIHAHYKSLHPDVAIVKLTPKVAESIYRRTFANAEFFPKDIHTILSSKLNLGTFLSMPKKSLPKWDPKTGNNLSTSYAIVSVWNTKEVFKLQVKGASKLTYACCMGLRMLDTWMPWMRLPSLADVFRRQFGVYVMHGLYMEGKYASRLMKSLCSFAYNMGRDDDGCGALVAEVGHMDPLRKVIPHWKRFSWSADLWCIKKLDNHDDQSNCGSLDWMKSKPSTSVIFVDPRDV